MNLSFFKNSKKLVVGALLAVSCIGIASVGFAEAKAFEKHNVLKGTYVHEFRNEFFTRNANLYNAYFNPQHAWGEVYAREESGMDGSVKISYMIGDIKRDANDNYVLNVKRHVIKKLDNTGKINMNKIVDVDYNIDLYHRMESGVKMVWNKKGDGPCADIDGEYITSVEGVMMTKEAAEYVLDRFMINHPTYRYKLMGASTEHSGFALAETHDFKLVEHHPDHVVTRGRYQVTYSGSILEYDSIMDRWNEITN